MSKKEIIILDKDKRIKMSRDTVDRLQDLSELEKTPLRP